MRSTAILKRLVYIRFLPNIRNLDLTWKSTNAGTYNVKLRKENHLNNKSPAVSKQVIVQNQKFILIASGTMISVHLK